MMQLLGIIDKCDDLNLNSVTQTQQLLLIMIGRLGQSPLRLLFQPHTRLQALLQLAHLTITFIHKPRIIYNLALFGLVDAASHTYPCQQHSRQPSSLLRVAIQQAVTLRLH